MTTHDELNPIATYGSTSLHVDPSIQRSTYSSFTKKKLLRFIWVLPFFGLCTYWTNLSSWRQHTNEHNNEDQIVINIIQTAWKTDDRLQVIGEKTLYSADVEYVSNNKPSHLTDASYISVDSTTQYQEIFGFGGAFTEASAIQFDRLSSKLKARVIDMYFDKDEGIGYNFGRVHINSCDFSEKSYNFDDVPGDVSLAHFDMTVSHDRRTMIPFIKRAMERQPNLNLFASPWSPPAWMKLANNGVQNMTGSAMPNGLDPRHQNTWARYISKFITAYKAHDINLWGITVQNEPGFAAPWEACAYTPEYMRDFVKLHLGPIIHAEHPEVKIMFFDHNRDGVYAWAKALYDDHEAAQYVSGVAFHWYASTDRLLDGMLNFNSLQQTQKLNPDKFLLATESCNCPGVAKGKQAWFRAQRYAHDIINDLNNHARGWVDWNLILDHTGGPNHLGNRCDAPLLVDKSGNDIIVQPMYYFIGHFSKYITPGSKRVDAKVHVKFAEPGEVDLYNGYPGGAWNCDGSSRQQWNFTTDERLKVGNSDFCMTNTDGANVQFWKCWETNTQRWKFENGLLKSINDNKCVYLDDSISTEQSGTLLLKDCNEVQNAKWEHNEQAKTLQWKDKCMTAGYAFIQSVAFITPEENKVLVVLNENSVHAKFVLKTDGKETLATIPGKSIQTYTW